MQTWAWLLAYVLGFGILQLVLYHHFRSSGGTPESAAGSSEGTRQGGVESRQEADPDGPSLYCQHCGARNEGFSTIRYCRDCTNPLR